MHKDHHELAVYGVEAPPEPQTLVEIFQQTVATYPQARGLEGVDGVFTYSELAQRVENLASRLRAEGIGPGHYAGVRVPSGTTDLYVAILGVIHAGAAYVPVDWDESPERAQTVFQEAGVSAVVGEGLEIDFHLTGEPSGSESPDLEDDAWVIFTSGSTGVPKGVAVTHRSAGALVSVEKDLFLPGRSLSTDDRVMAGLSVAFDASCEEMWLAWASGACLVAAPRDVVRSGPALGEWIVDQEITVVSTVPTLASLWPTDALEKVRLLIFGGEACPLDLVLRLASPNREIWNTYGPTETTVIVSAENMNGEPPVRIGRPISGWELAVVDPETEQPVTWGQSGELVVGGVGLGRYLDPELDAVQYAPLPALGWQRAYRTGDIVQADREGLIFVGRIDDQIKLGGVRIELGEIDDHISKLEGVSAGAAVLQGTSGGAEVLVCYLAPLAGAEINLEEARTRLSRVLPGGVVPVLAVVDELPMKTSGKVDRDALPWPLPTDHEEDDEHLSATQRWMKNLWTDQLGPMPIGRDTNFFEMGGGSVQVARLMANIRQSHPTAEMAELYNHPTLEQMSAYVESLSSVASARPMTPKLPVGPRIFQVVFIAAAYVLNAGRYISAIVAVVWVLGAFLGAGWVPSIPLLPVVLAWVAIFSTPGRMVQASITARILTIGITPGAYPRGGWLHVRVWAAERFLHHLRLESLLGTTYAATLFRMMGNRAGKNTHIACLPPVTGLVTVGDDVAIEFEADLTGCWVEGGTFYVGALAVGDGARIGTRCILAPNVVVGDGAEVDPGANVDRDIPAGERWGGSPIELKGLAGLAWPTHGYEGRRWRRVALRLAESASLALMTFLPIVAVGPVVAITMPRVINYSRFEQVAATLAPWVPVAAIIIPIVWLTMIVLIVRLLNYWIAPGYYPECSIPGWAVWFTHALLHRTLISTYPIYASIATPWFLRLLGARVGKDVEISTIETIPHLTWLQDRTFIADHALVTSTRHQRGWVHIGTSVIGEGAFIGNSAIVGPDTDLPRDSLIAVLSSSPRRVPAGSSWLGRPAQLIPLTQYGAAEVRTYRPSPRLKRLRAMTEALRILPFMITMWIDLGIVVGLNAVYTSANISSGSRIWGLGVAFVVGIPLILLAGVVATLIAIAAKWVLMGRFKTGEHPLFDGFVWRNELADVFAESLAVPSIIRLSIGSPVFNLYARAMGAKIGKHVWCETWWLPEFDLIHLADYATINRGTVIQTHLFQDRVMTLSQTTMDPGSTLGASSFMLPGSRIGERAVVGVGSLVLRDEYLPPDTYWQGNPVNFVHNEPQAQSHVEALLVAPPPVEAVDAGGVAYDLSHS